MDGALYVLLSLWQDSMPFQPSYRICFATPDNQKLISPSPLRSKAFQDGISSWQLPSSFTNMQPIPVLVA
jgi:hypothetical protein